MRARSVILALAPAVILAGCGLVASAGVEGPLAVERTNLGMEALSHGTLAIEGRCTWIVADEDRWLLVWPADAARWDALAGAVVFRDRDGREHHLRDGDEVALGGGAISKADGEPFGQIDWVVPPAPGCETGTRWHVSGVVMP